MAARFDASEFTASTAKPLPVVLLLDTSPSMSWPLEGSLATSGTRIDALNGAVRKMLGTLAKEESQTSEFLVSMITFGTSPSGKAVELVIPPTAASGVRYSTLSAGGNYGTPLGAALDVAKALIEDKSQTPSRAYRPLVVLVSDGEPNDSWQAKLDDFVGNGRSAKCDRMALGIGQDAITGPGRAMLDRFAAGTERAVFEAQDGDKIHEFFRLVTMSVVTRSLSQNPNVVPKDSILKPPTAAAAPAQAPAAPALAAAPQAATARPALAAAAAVAAEDEDSYW